MSKGPPGNPWHWRQSCLQIILVPCSESQELKVDLKSFRLDCDSDFKVHLFSLYICNPGIWRGEKSWVNSYHALLCYFHRVSINPLWGFENANTSVYMYQGVAPWACTGATLCAWFPGAICNELGKVMEQVQARITWQERVIEGQTVRFFLGEHIRVMLYFPMDLDTTLNHTLCFHWVSKA